MSTYTIIVSHEMLIGTIRDGEDVSAATASALAEAELEQDETLYTESGLTLTDTPEDWDEEVWSGTSMGWLSDENGRSFLYAVRRAEQ